jgi:hypothetical protein
MSVQEPRSASLCRRRNQEFDREHVIPQVFVGDDNCSQPTISITLVNEIPMTGKNYHSEQPTFVGANWGRR